MSPQLYMAGSAEAATGVDGSPHPPVSVVAEALQLIAIATAQPPPLPLTSDLPQLTAVATALMPGSPTGGTLLSGTGVDLLDRPGSSPLPVSKMLRMVSEDQANLLSDLAAQCAAPGGLLGPGPAGQVQPDHTGAFGAAPQQEACSPSGQTVPSPMGNHTCSAQPAQHAQRSLRRHTSPRLEPSDDAGYQVSASPSAAGPTQDESYLQSAQTHTSPLRKRLSQFFSPIFGGISPQTAHLHRSLHVPQSALLQSASHSQSQQLQQHLPDESAIGEPAVWQLPSPQQPAAALLAAGHNAVAFHGELLCCRQSLKNVFCM